MEKEEAQRIIWEVAHRTEQGMRSHGFSREQMAEALELTRPPKNWDHMADSLSRMLDQDIDTDMARQNYDVDRVEAFAEVMGVLFPEWETGDWTPDLSFLAWLGQNCGWHGFDKANVPK